MTLDQALWAGKGDLYPESVLVHSRWIAGPSMERRAVELAHHRVAGGLFEEYFCVGLGSNTRSWWSERSAAAVDRSAF